MTDREALEEIQKLLDGVHWTPSTLDEISYVMMAAGFMIRSPETAERERNRK